MSDDDPEKSAFRRLGSRALRTGAKLAKNTLSVGSTAAEQARRAAGWSRDAFERWVDEDEATILDNCPVVEGMLARRPQFEADPEVFGRLSSRPPASRSCRPEARRCTAS